MHELALTQSIVESVAEHAQGRRVRRVTLEIGRLAGVELDPLRFCFDLATEGTTLEGATLDIREIAGRARCTSCGREFVQEPSNALPLRGHEVERLSGDDLRVKEYELA